MSTAAIAIENTPRLGRGTVQLGLQHKSQTAIVARLARGLVDRCRELTVGINELTAEITTMVTSLAPALMAIPGCGAITAAKIVGETAGVVRFRSKDAFARHPARHLCRSGRRTRRDTA